MSGLECIRSEVVEQFTDARESVTLHKEVLQLPGDESTPPIGIVRKHLPGGPTLPPVLLVHGFAQNRYTWHTSERSPSAWLASLGFDVWNMELRGHGRSADTMRRGAEQFADYVADVQRVARAIGEPAFWIGHSLGGAAIYGAAAEEPSLTRGVIGIGAIYTFAQHNRFLRLLARITWKLRDIPGLGNLQIRTRLGGDLASSLYSLTDVAGYTVPVSGWWPGSIEPDLLAERLTRGFDWTSVTVWQEMSRWAVTGVFEYDEAWRAAKVPLLVILGDFDHLVPPGDGRAAFDRSESADKTLLLLDDFHHKVHWGHLDLVIGTRAREYVWTPLADWMTARSGHG
ncbi:MAG: alpha/beta fold hydrolase [Myxococcota bacterium]|nr:alpha/beta fold hydrolase [Myxococcota bacterium]